MNTAQHLILSYFGTGQLKADPSHAYKAPHAMRGTPARPHHKRQPRMVFSKQHNEMIPVRRPFKGHRV